MRERQNPRRQGKEVAFTIAVEWSGVWRGRGLTEGQLILLVSLFNPILVLSNLPVTP